MKFLDQVFDKNINLKDISLVQNSYMYDRDGFLVLEIVSDYENCVFVLFDKIFEEVKQIFLMFEDWYFYEYKGFDFMGMVWVIVFNVKDKKIDQGVSIIIQQFLRNLYLSYECFFSCKLIEFVYFYQLEKKYMKDEIFEVYLNIIYFNNGVYGVGLVVEFYFSKLLKFFIVGEMVFICVIFNNFILYDFFKYFDYMKNC